MGPIDAETAARFWRKVQWGGRDGCWLWLGAKRDGYGQFRVAGRQHQAHRVAWVLTGRGPIPEGLVLHHLCAQPACVAPHHMALATVRANTLAGRSPAARHAQQSHCWRGHPFDAANTRHRSRPEGGRVCRACDRERYRRRAAAQRRSRPTSGRALTP